MKRNSGTIPESLPAPVRADGETRAELGETVADHQIAMLMGPRSRQRNSCAFRRNGKCAVGVALLTMCPDAVNESFIYNDRSAARTF
jgi:hypothetical protein